jgi:selenocysteine lyase/cysteine desulfurase
MDDQLIYLDNAATSHPKPENVIQAMAAFIRDVGGNPGRSGHRLSIAAGRVVFESREKIAALFGVSDSSRVIFGQNATEGINLGLKGLLRRGDHVITSSFNLEIWAPSDLSFRLDEEFGILTRVGLHCAPSAHRTIGTFPDGTVRVSISYLNTEEEITQSLQAIKTLARKGA